MSNEPLNPYSSPAYTEPPIESSSEEELSHTVLIQQKMIALLLIIHGCLGLLAGVVYAVAAVLMPEMIAKNGGWGPDPEAAKTRIAITSATMSACALIPGILQIVAGFRNWWLKGYTLGMIAIGSSLAMIGSCYCAPSALALFAYGLVIYLLPTTRRAFALAQLKQAE